ncbi:MAG: glycosyltransferase family 2 protein [Bacilli bacterium]|nr:glycosyltransferase family 2 protein [Bacilli bacterium]
MTKVSVLIPVYNASKYLKDTLNSVVKQSLKDIEIVIANDGSTDDSEEVIRKFKKKYKNIKYFYKKNTGVADTRNFLIEHANGEYIAFLDSDDTIDRKMYEEMYNLAIDKKADMVICDFNEIHDLFTVVKKGINEESKILSPPALWNKLVKKEFYLNNRFPDVTIGEDMTVILRMMVKKIKIEYINKPFYNYYKRPNSLMNKAKYSKYWEDIFVVFDLLNDVLSKYPEELEFLFIQHVLRDSSIKFMYYEEGLDDLKRINIIAHDKYSHFCKNKYYKRKKFRYRFVCFLIYHKMYFAVKLIRKIMNSDR